MPSFVHSIVFVYLMLLPIRMLLLYGLERRFAAYPVTGPTVMALDLLTMIFFAGVTFQLAGMASRAFGVGLPVPHAIDLLPVIVRVMLYLLVADFGHYWIHRVSHSPLMWRIHRWHHSPAHMSWAAGNRDTFLDATLVNLAYIFALPLLGTVSHRVELMLLIFVILKNDWMHLNVRWRLPWLEGVLVTPRSHHIHHSRDPAHLNRNFGVLLSVWDRLFGTYFHPDHAPAELQFGTGEVVPTARLVAGI